MAKHLTRHGMAALATACRTAWLTAMTLAAALLTAACSKTDSEYTTYPCRFVFNTQRHGQSAALMSTVSGTGIFCKVTKTVKGGAQYYHFETNAGLADDVIFTTEDTQSTVALGMNGALIFGYGNLDVPKTFYAYDGECPNCFSPDAIPVRSHPLTMSGTGMATCATCHRSYNMNTGGNVVSGDNGRKMTRYHATCAADGTVAIIN